MNWLAKNGTGWLMASVILFYGCKDGLGLEVTPEIQQTKVEFIEFVLPTTNLYFDSLRTDEGSNLLVGEYTDDIFGSVKATGYSELFYRDGPLPYFFYDTAGILLENENNINFDSLSFESVSITLRIADFLTSSDLLIQNIQFFNLEDPIYSDVIYLSDREISLGESIGSDIASFSSMDMSLLDMSADTLIAEFQLNDSYGQEIFDRIANLDPDDSDSISSRLIKFPGIGFVSNGSNSIVNYELFHELSNIKIHTKGDASDSIYVIRFQFADFLTANHFNRIERDRQGSDFEALIDGRALDVNNDFVYFNPISGIMPRIDLSPYLEFAKQIEQKDIVVQRAQLSIGALQNEEYIPAVETSKFYFSNADSTNISDLVFNINWSGLALDPYGTLLQTDFSYLAGNFPTNIITQFDTVSLDFNAFPNIFFQDILDQTQTQAELYSDNLVMVSAVNSSLGRAIIPKDSVKLRILYIRLK